MRGDNGSEQGHRGRGIEWIKPLARVKQCNSIQSSTSAKDLAQNFHSGYSISSWVKCVSSKIKSMDENKEWIIIP